MAKRTPLIAGNWKMNKGVVAEATALAAALVEKTAGATGVEIAVFPPFVALHAVTTALEGSDIGVGGQDMFFRPSGAYTGQISAEMLKDTGSKYALLGHSERRGRFGVAETDFDTHVLQLFGETDTTVNRKTVVALAAGLVPVVCIGETLSERQVGTTDAVVAEQVVGALHGIDAAQVPTIVFAYEPVWSIGTGVTCDAEEADRVCGVVRSTVEKLYGTEVAEAVRVLYGGSMKPDNAVSLLAKPNIDGGLIGGASLKADDFAAIVKAAA